MAGHQPGSIKADAEDRQSSLPVFCAAHVVQRFPRTLGLCLREETLPYLVYLALRSILRKGDDPCVALIK